MGDALSVPFIVSWHILCSKLSFKCWCYYFISLSSTDLYIWSCHGHDHARRFLMRRFRIVESQTGNVRFKFTTSLGPGYALGKIGKKMVQAKKKNPGERREPRGSLGPPLGPLRSPMFFLFDPVFCLFYSTAEPGPRLDYKCTPQTRKWADIHVCNADLLLLLIYCHILSFLLSFLHFCFRFLVICHVQECHASPAVFQNECR